MPGPSSCPWRGRPASNRSVSRAPRPAGRMPASRRSRQHAGATTRARAARRRPRRCSRCRRPSRVRRRTRPPVPRTADLGPPRLQRIELLAGGGPLDRDHGPARGDVVDRALAAGVTAGRVLERGEQRRGVRRVRHDEELVLGDPPHDDVVDDVRVVGVEQVRVLRASRLDASQVVRERPLQHVEGARSCDPHGPEMRHVERDRVLAASAVLLEHARVLDRHLPAAERRHARAERAVLGVERAVTQRRVSLGHGREPRRRTSRSGRLGFGAGALRGRTGAPAEPSTSKRNGAPSPSCSLSCDGGSSPYFTSRCR